VSPFYEPELKATDPRSYVDLPTNIGFIARLSAGRNLADFHRGQLPEDFLLVFLHEAMHHWCFHSALGFAMAGLFQRAAANSAMFADAVHGQFSLSLDESRRISQMEDAFNDLLRFDMACHILMPLIEGLALFCEFDVQPEPEPGGPLPIGMASALFGRSTNSAQNGLFEQLKERLLRFRLADEMVDRKHRVLLMDPRASGSPYLAGYLSVKSTWHCAASFCSELASAGAFATFLRNYIFEDLELVRCLLKADITGPNNEMPFASAFATRLRDRSGALLVAKSYQSIAKYRETLERVIDEDHDALEPYPPELSLTDAETVTTGWQAIRELIDEFDRNSAPGANGAIYWSATQTALAQRHVMTLEVAEVHVKIISGICSVWSNSQATTPLLTGLLCRVPSANGKQGPGQIVMLVPTRFPVPFFAVLKDREVLYDSLPAGIPADVADDFRSVARNIPDKMHLSGMSESNLNALVRRTQESYVNYSRNIDPSLDKIYFKLEMPWLPPKNVEVVISTLLLGGNGLAALFPRGKKHLLKAVVSLSLGSGFNVLLDEAGQGECLLDVINRINEMARNVWHEGLIHVHDDESCSTVF
jgi:hypothetical protein